MAFEAEQNYYYYYFNVLRELTCFFYFFSIFILFLESTLVTSFALHYTKRYFNGWTDGQKIFSGHLLLYKHFSLTESESSLIKKLTEVTMTSLSLQATCSF